jgi:hypothetical protein
MKLMFVAHVAAKLGIATSMVTALSGCVIAPLGPPHRVAVDAAVVVAPAPPVVVVRPAVRYYPYRHRHGHGY